MYGPVTLEIDGEMKFSRPARGPPLARATPRGAATQPRKIGTPKIAKKVEFFSVAVPKTRPVFNFDHFFRRRPPSPLVPSLLVGGTFDSAKILGSNFESENIQTKKIEKKVEKSIFGCDFENAAGSLV